MLVTRAGPSGVMTILQALVSLVSSDLQPVCLSSTFVQNHLGQFPFWVVDYRLGMACPTGKAKCSSGALPDRDGKRSTTAAGFAQVFPQLFGSSAVAEMLVVWEW